MTNAFSTKGPSVLGKELARSSKSQAKAILARERAIRDNIGWGGGAIVGLSDKSDAQLDKMPKRNLLVKVGKA